jgi:hypothetical protein
MRTDKNGNQCPGTLGEYLDLIHALTDPVVPFKSRAVAFLEQRIEQSPNGSDEIVITPDSQVQAMLMPWAFIPADEEALLRKSDTSR